MCGLRCWGKRKQQLGLNQLAGSCWLQGIHHIGTQLQALSEQWRACCCYAAAAGLPPDEAETQGFWDLFFTQSLSPTDFQIALASSQSFTMLATLQACYSLTARSLMVDFRCAAGLAGRVACRQ